MRVNFRPATDSSVTLFAHWGEAIVFWLSLGALVFLGIVFMFKYLYFKEVKADFSTMLNRQLPPAETVEHPKRAFALIADSLSREIEENHRKIGEMQKTIDSLISQSRTPQKKEQPATVQPPQQDNRDQNILNRFQIQSDH